MYECDHLRREQHWAFKQKDSTYTLELDSMGLSEGFDIEVS